MAENSFMLLENKPKAIAEERTIRVRPNFKAGRSGPNWKAMMGRVSGERRKAALNDGQNVPW